ncbi:MAG: molybdenum cofactor biosynthesis protein MoaE [Gammaproteobacteria bacterium]|nr:MAG: molybdenum cofactor biosynthesis protein MoaE [Gammaproteobacteria bacterium]
MISIAVQAEDFDIGREYRQLRGDDTGVGGIALFTGLVRDISGNPLVHMHLEHYPGMTEASLQQTAEQAAARWSLLDIRIVHRIGELAPGDQIVLVGVSSAHRADAFSACEFIMDVLKTTAPFWKKEIHRDGSGHWVDAKTSDQQRASRWEED